MGQRQRDEEEEEVKALQRMMMTGVTDDDMEQNSTGMQRTRYPNFDDYFILRITG